MKSTIKQFMSSSFVPESFGFVIADEEQDSVPLVSRNKCHAASLSALRSFPRPFSVEQRPSCIILPSRNARAFRRLKLVWIAKNLLLHSFVTFLLVTLLTIQKLLREYSMVIVVLGCFWRCLYL